MPLSRFSVAIHGPLLTATAWGEPLDIARHHPAAESKGATYTALRVAREPTGGSGRRRSMFFQAILRVGRGAG